MTTEYKALKGLQRVGLMNDEGNQHIEEMETRMQLEGRGLEIIKN